MKAVSSKVQLILEACHTCRRFADVLPPYILHRLLCASSKHTSACIFSLGHFSVHLVACVSVHKYVGQFALVFMASLMVTLLCSCWGTYIGVRRHAFVRWRVLFS
mmetsp:Transcript_124705/g.195421  ORF Transcript_124705/g.195421 Transcript_124705/m.195421 type:complete len:105 (+) Transcript_124705:270-584(+)